MQMNKRNTHTLSHHKTVIEKIGARARLAALCSELEEVMPKPEDSISKLMKETLSGILLTIKHDGKEALLGESEIENTLSSLTDKSTLLLQELFEKNKTVKAEKKATVSYGGKRE
jgi:hypothetical protein